MNVSLGKLISRLYWHTQSYFEKNLSKYSIGSGEIPILLTLYREGNLNQNALTEKLFIDKATVSREIRRLVDMGYVKRKREEKDRRNYLVSLTEKGRNIIPKIREISVKWREILLKNFSEKEENFIIQAMEKMIENACVETKRLKNGGNN